MRRPNIKLIGAIGIIIGIIGIIIAINYGITRANAPVPVGVGFMPTPATFAATPRSAPGTFFAGLNGTGEFYEKVPVPGFQPEA